MVLQLQNDYKERQLPAVRDIIIFGNNSSGIGNDETRGEVTTGLCPRFRHIHIGYPAK